MKKFFFFLCFFVCTTSALANHLKGGFFTYEYLGPGLVDTTHLRYKVRLTVYMICNPSAGQLDNPVPFTFFDATSNLQVKNVMVDLSSQYKLNRAGDEQCITGDQRGCYYTIVIYELASVELPPTANGYTVSYQRCCRIIGIQNMPSSPASNSFGNTYSINIPGTTAPHNAITNKSAVFLVNDTAVVCGGSYFEVPFIATDPNPGDSLSYFFCDAWLGGGNGSGSGIGGSSPNPAAPPPYGTIPYGTGFTGSSPLGNAVSIDAATGLISGIAPVAPGEYVVTVCVNEWRQGIIIAQNRKELHLTVGDCNAIQANISINNQLINQSNPQYINCESFALNFANPTTAGVNSHFWDFGMPQAGDTSDLINPTFLYPDTGSYTVTLYVNKGQACSDSAKAIIKLYPGFYAGFTFSGICVNNPTLFNDTTKTDYGTVSGWRWNFDDATTSADTSIIKNPSYTYTQTGIKNVSMIVRSSLGCIDTVTKAVEILTTPPLSVAFSDTLICIGDSVQLQAIGTGNFTWTPATNIINANTADPTVFPSTTVKYAVELNQNGCINNDTVQVRVVSFVTLNVRADTTICLTDSVRLFASGNGLQYSWAPVATIANPNVPLTMALPPGNTVYTVTSRIGSCTTTGNTSVITVPYPQANAGADTIICFATGAQLQATIVGSSFTWSPTNSLNNPNILNPVAKPNSTTTYILSVTDVQGCPKPGKDSITVTVLPKIIPDAGSDTAIVVGQPLQFNASGGVNYLWTPSTGLSSVTIADPIGLYDGSFDSIRYQVLVFDQAGCVDSAFIMVKVFRTEPIVFVPSAFTPNKDGKNDVFRPIAVGLTKIEYFRVFNRWGQLVFSTTTNGQGWDGRIKGMEQGTGTFVWLVKGVDFTGKTVFQKGTVTLIK